MRSSRAIRYSSFPLSFMLPVRREKKLRHLVALELPGVYPVSLISSEDKDDDDEESGGGVVAIGGWV